MKIFGLIYCIAFTTISHAQIHPIAFATGTDMELVKKKLKDNYLLAQSFDELKSQVDGWIGKDIDVPVPKDAAGGYTHDKHKANYILLFNSGLLYQLTGEKKYAQLVKNVLLKYSALNPTLKNHPQATSSSPGRLFWQALNDANWLVYAGLSFDCIHDYLTLNERITIANGAFKPEVDYFTKDIKTWYDLIHNHAVWACAGVGIVGIATDNDDYVKMALYGSNKDGKAGFIAQLDGLFSPDGYYNEGPYYTRYAILPFYLLANAINNTSPSLKIFQYRQNILEKALEGALEQTNLNGAFYTYNDALKDKTFITNEIVVALDIAWQVYGYKQSYLPIAKSQGRVILNSGGVSLSEALQKEKNIPLYYPYKSVEYTDGANGDKGGVAVLRNGVAPDLTSLVFKYSSHGMAHGHFDKLNINLYDNGNEILQDYGASRFINIEQKWGGRYLPETKSYAQQSIAHNTITVDETSHYHGDEKESERNHPIKLFGNVGKGNVQVISSLDSTAYHNVVMQRSIYMINLPEIKNPITVDFFRNISATSHQYDLPFNYLGTVISTNFPFTANTKSLTTLGNANGYEHLWKEAEARVSGKFNQFTFLNHKTFYTISTCTNDSASIYFTLIGANDPNFNLRNDPSYIIRTKGNNETYINVIEPHGDFNAVSEIATNAYADVSGIEKLQDDENITVVSIKIKNKTLLIIQTNKDFDKTTKHFFNKGEYHIEWNGPYYVTFDNKKIN